METKSNLVDKKSVLVDKVDKLVESSSVVEKKILIGQISKLLNLSIENELMFSRLVKEGAVYKDSSGEEKVSDTAIALHSKRKDSISDLVKIKQSLEGLTVDGGQMVLIIKTSQEKDELKEIILRLEDLNKKLELDGDDNLIGTHGNRLN